MAYADQPQSTRRTVAIVLVVLLHIVLGYALATGLAFTVHAGGSTGRPRGATRAGGTGAPDGTERPGASPRLDGAGLGGPVWLGGLDGFTSDIGQRLRTSLASPGDRACVVSYQQEVRRASVVRRMSVELPTWSVNPHRR